MSDMGMPGVGFAAVFIEQWWLYMCLYWINCQHGIVSAVAYMLQLRLTGELIM